MIHSYLKCLGMRSSCLERDGIARPQLYLSLEYKGKEKILKFAII